MSTSTDARARTKVVLVKPGLDCHYRGALVVARFLSAQGLEVVYAGNQTPVGAAAAVEQEDAHVLGISSLSGNHLHTVPAILTELRDRGLHDVTVVVGGIVPHVDRPALLRAGVSAVFGPGDSLTAIADHIRTAAAALPDAARQG
ncbi:cobalamin-dependent protein [Streptomyces sp. AV19]|uniref:cobalamin B12-binding domain-containing protein n=1 Tax=Streptomyces sp. AV19 TaxID=2793068 RepID=UPI0018FF0DB6|nr:cobalamin-dependent protein [Streptomyces sp. AV19]MBH1937665.1 cobalamin-dependent protein [Streptomyces sp. AV19]MDG4536332.1 cobalamin-dependent protein [Streptomyces sp. AV19]